MHLLQRLFAPTNYLAMRMRVATRINKALHERAQTAAADSERCPGVVIETVEEALTRMRGRMNGKSHG